MRLNIRLVPPVFGLLICVQLVRAAGFTFSNGTYTTFNFPDDIATEPFAINDSGQIVGDYFSGIMFAGGFVYTDGVFDRLFPNPLSPFLRPRGINNVGQIVGGYVDNLGHAHAFLDTNGTFTTFDFFSAALQPIGINDAGQIASGGTLYTNGVLKPLPFNATGINDAGQIVGQRTDVGVSHGILDTNDVITTIDVPGSFSTVAMGINTIGQIVGYYLTLGTDNVFHEHGFLDINGVFITIDFPGAFNTMAWGINDAGEVVGIDFTPPQPNPIPEPGSFVLVACGLIGLIGMINLKARYAGQQSADLQTVLWLVP
jgi:probable HAF family extracellular repeat protein